MSVSNDLSLVYTGSRVEGLLLKELLEEKGIGVFKRDTLEASVIAGWAEGSPEDACKLYVETKNTEKAQEFLEAYFKTRNKK
ncbi:MAG: hypothetical protein DRJ09_02350 [Bacteroidetes bacterium]|nr:MAG: hypothetical protein DRJ09_02350 [Bacteroidota bacterium]